MPTAAQTQQDGADLQAQGATNSIAWSIRNVHRLFAQALHSHVADYMPNISHWYYLRILWEEDGLTQLELSRRVGISPTTAVPALNSMEKHGLIARARDSRDRRKVNVYLTHLGRELRKQLQPKAFDINSTATKGIPEDDLVIFERVLFAIKENLKESFGNQVSDQKFDE
jgi:DNA-binding MarR family transcriptional regulator